MDLTEGFKIEKPEVLVPWGISEPELLHLLPTMPRLITDGYYAVDCVSLGGLRHVLGFHFEPRSLGSLHRLEFSLHQYPDDLSESFADFDAHLRSAFGPPQWTRMATTGFPDDSWNATGALIRHCVAERFGLEEHVYIVRPSSIGPVGL